MITPTKSLAGVALVVSATLALSACAGNADSGSGEANRTLIGAGASSQGAAQEAWVAGFQTANPDVTVTYDPIGSGGGRETFQSGASSFAGSDRAFKVEEIAEGNFGSCVADAGIWQIPAYISPIAVIFNLDGIGSLNLDADTLAQIFTGQIGA